MPSLSFHEYVIAISFIISLTVYFRPVKGYAYLKYFSPFLLLTLAVELYAHYVASQGQHNTWLYNFFSVVEFCFYLWILSIIVIKNKWRKSIRVSIPAYLVISLANILFVQGITTFHSITYCLGCLLIVVYCIYYFSELFRTAKWDKLSANPAFWICSGLLFFYCCGFPFFGLLNYWTKVEGLQFLVKNFITVNTVLNVFLYSLFSIAFLCNRTRKYTLSSS
jgi:hypothetical protein